MAPPPTIRSRSRWIYGSFVLCAGLLAARLGYLQILQAPYLSGYVQHLDALAIGLAGKEIGAGRLKKGDAIDLAVGINLHKKVGDWVEKGEALASLLVNDEAKVEPAASALMGAYQLGPEPVSSAALIKAIYRQEPTSVR